MLSPRARSARTPCGAWLLTQTVSRGSRPSDGAIGAGASVLGPVRQQVRLAELGELYASPVAAAGRIYISDRDGTTLVLKAADKLDVLDTTFPHDRPQVLYWNVQSDFDGEGTIEITYFTSGITWSAQTLEAYLTDPQALVPGNRMPYAGMADPQGRADLIAYLAKASK